MLINAVWACFVDFSHVTWPPPLSVHLVLSLSGELTVQSNLVNMDTEAASILSRDGTRIFQSGFSDSHVRSNWGPKHFGWVPKSWWPSPEKFRFVVVMRKSDCQITVILITRPVQSIKQQTNVAEAHWSFLDVLIVSSLLCVVKSNMAATMCQKFEIWWPPSWRTPSSLVTSMWRQCAQPEFGRKFKSLITSCFFILELHKRSWTEKTQSEVKRKEVLNDLIFLPYSGWAHWRHILVTRLLGVLQDGGCQILNFWLLQTRIS